MKKYFLRQLSFLFLFLAFAGCETNSYSLMPRPAAQKQPLASEGFYYTVKQGDTLQKIAREHNLSVEVLIKVNRLSDKNLININQKIFIPIQDQPNAS